MSIAIIDLGGQYCHLISRRIRELGVPATIYGHQVTPADIKGHEGIVLSGGPNSVYDPASPTLDPGIILDSGIPVLGICYGHQLLAQTLGGKVEKSDGEYGPSQLSLNADHEFFRDTARSQTVWMSHSDSVTTLPKGATVLGTTSRCAVAAFALPERGFYGVQFHPEVVHSECGQTILRNFVHDVCGISAQAETDDPLTRMVAKIRKQAGERSVFFLVSGGVDSTVAFALCARALGRNRVLGLYVDTGLMRKNETAELKSNLESLGLGDRLSVVDASARFLDALAAVCDPEEKRHVIGRLFIEVQAEATSKIGINAGTWLLGQGTIYPDTIESGGAHGRAAVIKTHHNRCKEVVELIEKGLVIEPLVEFYKDEVRELGLQLGLSPQLIQRWPFPGPGLAIRCLCVDGSADRRVGGSAGPGAAAKGLALPSGLPQYEAVHLPLRSVGVQGDGRTYREIVAVRGPLDYDALQDLSSTLCNTGTAYNRVIAYLAGEMKSLSEGMVRPATMTLARLHALREADFVVRTVMAEQGLTDSVWQFPVAILPLYYTDGETIVLRPVNSADGMTAKFGRLPANALATIANTIAEIPGVGAVFLDVTDKPPATIEWE